MNDNDLIGKYIELRDRKAQMTKDFENTLTPIVGAMETIENAMAARLLASGQESVRTENGTAYRTTVMTTKVIDREAFIAYVKEFDAFDMLPASAVKESVKEYMETSAGRPPPGVDITTLYKTNFRKS